MNLRDYEAQARLILPAATYDYYAGGAGDEQTVGENERAWSAYYLRPRVLVDVSACDLTTTLLGKPSALPIVTAPCAFNQLAHPDGERAVARATAALGIVQTLSTMASTPLEEVGAVPGTRWFQLYCQRDRGVTRALIERAEAAGFAALCLTVDVPITGTRERDYRNQFTVPDHIPMANLAPYLLPDAERGTLHDYARHQFDPGLTWESLDWLRSVTRLPLVLKGILTAEDAQLAVAHGVEGIVVSNHGGRQLDGVVPTALALPEVAEVVAGKAEVYVDGGIRRGTDILKALALGARAVLIGRPYLWGLAVGGEAGVTHVLTLLRDDLERAAMLLGCPKLTALSAAFVRAPYKEIDDTLSRRL